MQSLQLVVLFGDEPFAVLLGDDVVINEERPAIKQLMDESEKNRMLSYLEYKLFLKNQTHRYGVIAPKGQDGTYMKLKNS